MDLKTFYDDLKTEKDRLDSGITPVVHGGSPINTRIANLDWKRKANDCAKQLTDNCARHIILDIYCKVLPLDDDFIQGNMGMMKADVDNMLATKGMTPTQYLQSCANNTKAPMCEYVLNMCDLIGKQYLEDANEKLKDAKEKGIDVPVPNTPDPETDEQVSSQLIDIEEDPSYTTFIDKLKQKTIDKIVTDVSKIITDKKKDKDMSFDPKDTAMESTTAIAINSIQARLMKENVDCDSIMDDIMGLAIRESTLNMMNECFRMQKTDQTSFKSNMKFCKGAVITESAITSLIEAAKSAEEVDKVVNDADKKKNDEINSKLKASDVINASNDKQKDEKKPTEKE